MSHVFTLDWYLWIYFGFAYNLKLLLKNSDLSSTKNFFKLQTPWKFASPIFLVSEFCHSVSAPKARRIPLRRRLPYPCICPLACLGGESSGWSVMGKAFCKDRGVVLVVLVVVFSPTAPTHCLQRLKTENSMTRCRWS